MIDIHVLTHSGTRQEWLRQCITSLDGQPCTVHIVQGVEGSVGAGRAIGYAMGDHEFVGYVDSDDYVLPGALARCLGALRTHRAVVTAEWVEYPDGSRHPYPKHGHSIAVYRRVDVEPLRAVLHSLPHTADAMVRHTLRPTHLPSVDYVWRVHEHGDHNNITRAVLAAERALWL